jgi:Domain of unknown function (DUF397)
MLTGQWEKSTFSYCNSNCLEARWAKSSRSAVNGACLEAAFRKSSYSESGNCAEAAVRDGRVLVRDSKLGEGSPVLAFAPGAWAAFLAAVKSA